MEEMQTGLETPKETSKNMETGAGEKHGKGIV